MTIKKVLKVTMCVTGPDDQYTHISDVELEQAVAEVLRDAIVADEVTVEAKVID